MIVAVEDIDQDLITRLINRDEAALSVLYDVTIKKTYGLALKITHDKLLSEEIVEDTYFQVWQEIYHYDSKKCPLINWILIICRSRAIDAIRKKNRILEVVTDIDWHEDNFISSLQDQYEKKQNERTIQEAFSVLSAIQKQVLHHSFYFGLSHKEISILMKMPIGTVKSTINRAQKCLKDKLKGEKF